MNFDQDRDDIRRVIRDYLDASVIRDSSLIAKTVRPELSKRGYIEENGRFNEYTLTFEELKEVVKTFNSDGKLKKEDPIEITVFDVRETIASAKMEFRFGPAKTKCDEYMLLTKNDGNWMVTQVLWQFKN